MFVFFKMLNTYFFSEVHNNKFCSYSSMHFCVILASLFCVIVIFKAKLWLKRNDKAFRYISAAFLIITEIIYKYWEINNGATFMELLPLHFCDLTLIVTIYALLKNNCQATNLGLYWSILGSTLAILSPNITYGPPHFRFFHYFLVHFLPLICNLHFLITERIVISSKNNFLAIKYGYIVTISIFIMDIILNQNWFYMIYSPVKFISDFFGFPLYSILWYIFTNLCMRSTYFLLKFIRSSKKF